MEAKQICGICLHDHGDDNPCCPNCRHYNALLSTWSAEKSADVLTCRDCGFTPQMDCRGYGKSGWGKV